MRKGDANDLIGCCGVYCGLCNKYQSKAPSRCIGCKVGGQHSWCSIWNCCVRKHGFETCAECSEMPDCAIFSRRRVAEWIPAVENLRHIREVGVGSWLRGQNERQRLLEELLKSYNEGRSMSFYCKVCARMPIELIGSAMEESKRRAASEQVDAPDMKSKARILRAVIEDLALRTSVNLD